MTHPTRGVAVELDRERRLRYPMSAIKEIQARFDINLMAGEGLQAESLDDVVWVIWLGLRHEDPGEPAWWEKVLAYLGLRDVEPRITPELVAEWIDLENIAEVTEAMQRAMGGGEEVLEEVPDASGEGRAEKKGVGATR